MDYLLLVDTAVLAGEIMLTAGAETYRVEDTIRRILRTSGFDRCDVFAVPTGIMVTLADWKVNTISITRRIEGKNTNLHNIYEVNEISRKYCSGKIDLQEAFRSLKYIDKSIYPKWMVHLCMLLATAGFTLLLGGSAIDCILSAFNGIFILYGKLIAKKLNINDFVTTMCISFCTAFASIILSDLIFIDVNLEVLIAGSNMALLPGVAITNAIRDTLQGDYSSGVTRMIEAFVIAMSVGVGIGAGLAFGSRLIGLT